MSKQSDVQKKHWNITGVAIPAGVLIGLGVGFLIDNIPAGLFLVMMIGMMILWVKR